MFMEKNLAHTFDHLVQYTSEINQLNGGTATALIVIQNGQIVTEYYDGKHSGDPHARAVQPDSQFNVASARKSYIAFAVAWALAQGVISSIDDLVADYLPDYPKALMQNTTIRHLLTHTHGLEFEYAEPYRLYREFEAGADWAYRGANIIMLTEIVERTTGKNVAEILQEAVFNPLGFSETGWHTENNEQLVRIISDENGDPNGLGLGTDATGAGIQKNLYVSAREFAYWGYFHLRRGCIDGKQYVPAHWFDAITSVQSPLTDNLRLPQNGFLWYVKERQAELSEIGDSLPVGTFQILGVTGPLLLVIPKYDLVVARMYNKRGNYGGPDGSEWLNYLRDFGKQVMRCLD